MDVTMSEAIGGVIIALLLLVNTLIYRVAIPFVREQLMPWVRARTTRDERELAYGIVASAVGMAENLGYVHGLSGADKHDKAVGWIKRRFKRLGIEFDEDEVTGWIEDVVFHLEDGLAELIDLEVDPAIDNDDTEAG